MEGFSDTAMAGMILVERARYLRRSEATLTYSELAEMLGMPPFRGPDWGNHPLSSVLGALNEDDHAAGRPFRSSLVVSGDTSYSGKSFFRVVAELREASIPATDRRRYWDDEFTRLLQYYHNPDA